MTDQAIAACAEGEAAWHRVAYAGLHSRWTNDRRLARGYRQVPHPFLLGAVTLDRGVEVPDEVPGAVCDSFAELRLPGREPEPTGYWMVRSGSLPGVVGPLDVRIRRVISDADTAWFEAIAFLAADGEPPQHAGELHPPGSQSLPGLTLLIAEVGDEGVGTALSVTTPRVNNIGAVTVMPTHRGRGIGAALTSAAIAVAPSLPATLSATEAGRGVYRRLGFVEVGRPLHHHPVSVSEPGMGKQ